MLLPDHQYIKADSLSDCLQRLRDNGERAEIVGGGTDVIFNMRLKLFRPEVALSVRNLKELGDIAELPDGGLRIGAACRLADLARNQNLRNRYPALHEAITGVASTHIRNIATLGGNICLKTRCWYTNNSEQWREGVEGCFKTDKEHCHVIKSSTKCHAINNADTPVALIMLGARLTIRSADEARELPIADFYRDDGVDHIDLRPDEIVTHVTLPPVTDRTVFIKIAPRKGMDFSLAAVAARADGSSAEVRKVSIVLGSLSTAPVILDRPARIVSEGGLTDASIEQAVLAVRDELGELTNLFGRAAYKKHLANVLVRRALHRLREQ